MSNLQTPTLSRSTGRPAFSIVGLLIGTGILLASALLLDAGCASDAAPPWWRTLLGSDCSNVGTTSALFWLVTVVVPVAAVGTVVAVARSRILLGITITLLLVLAGASLWWVLENRVTGPLAP